MIKRQTFVRWGINELEELIQTEVKQRLREFYDFPETIRQFSANGHSQFSLNETLRLLDLPVQVIGMEANRFFDVLIVIEVDEEQELMDELSNCSFPVDALGQRVRLGDIVIEHNRRRLTMNVVTGISGQQVICNCNQVPWPATDMIRIEQAVKIK